MEEKEFNEQESLQLINEMIGKVKADFHESGISALLWGSVVISCSLVSLLNLRLKIPALDYVWLLTFVAIVPQVIVSMRESRSRRYKTYTDDAMSGIWTAFAIAIFILSFYSSKFQLPHASVFYLTLYGMPTFATGLMHRFRPMIIGGIVCWVFAIVCCFNTAVAVDYLLLALAAFSAWLLPGIILRRTYLKAKRHV